MQWLGHSVSYVALGADGFLDNPLFHEVLDRVVHENIVIRSFVGLKIACHVHDPLVMHADRDGCGDLHKFIQEVKDLQFFLAGIKDSNTVSLVRRKSTNMLLVDRSCYKITIHVNIIPRV